MLGINSDNNLRRYRSISYVVIYILTGALTPKSFKPLAKTTLAASISASRCPANAASPPRTRCLS